MYFFCRGGLHILLLLRGRRASLKDQDMHLDDAQLMTLMAYVQNAGASDDNTLILRT